MFMAYTILFLPLEDHIGESYQITWDLVDLERILPRSWWEWSHNVLLVFCAFGIV